ncbi:MAG: XRE family transcriptional regulator [Desulfuromonas sp.]|nr:MAG: XRE family transcriptional regulator [Desulfuromonas sp.]
MSDILPITVFLNGVAVKRIREEKKLTQLYVSKVVGVTTDTISRWENNRYPTIKRENALGLAEALEVDVHELLIENPDEVDAAEPRLGLSSHPATIAALVSLLLVAVLFYFLYPAQDDTRVVALKVLRKLPHYAAPGSHVPVRVNLSSPLPEGGFILREYFPKGWKLVQASPPASSLDNVNGVVRWIIKAGDKRERVVYMLQVDPAATPEHPGAFRGEIIVSGGDGQLTVPVEGETSVMLEPVLWADSNGDFVIDDAEMLQASYTVDEMSGVYIDWGKLEKLWDAGRYRWDEKNADFVPVR